MPTPILNLSTIATSSTSKEVIISTTFAEIEQAVSNYLVLDLSASNVTLTTAQWTRNVFFICNPVIGNRDLIVPLTPRLFAVKNNGTLGGIVTVKGITGATVELNQDDGAVLYCDGTNIFMISSSNTGAAGANPNDIGLFVPGIPPDGEIIARYQFTKDVEFADNFSGSQASSEVASASTATFDVLKNGVSIGSIVFNTSSTGTFSTIGTTVETFNIGDVLTIISPTPIDTNLESVSISFAGTRI